MALATPLALAENVGDVITTDALVYTVTAANVVEVAGPGASMPTALVIPSTVTGTDGQQYTVSAIANRAFYLKGVVSVDIPGSVETIGENAFTGASYKRTLESVTLNEGIKYIGPSASLSTNSPNCTSLHRLRPSPKPHSWADGNILKTKPSLRSPLMKV